jgi:hypothetical protein
MQRTKPSARQEELFESSQMELFRVSRSPLGKEIPTLGLRQPETRRTLICTLCLAPRPLLWCVSTDIRHSFTVCELCLGKIELTERQGPLDS